MTPQEVQALAQLLARMPMSPAEALWVRDLLARLTEKAPAPTPAATNGKEAAHAQAE